MVIIFIKNSQLWAIKLITTLPWLPLLSSWQEDRYATPQSAIISRNLCLHLYVWSVACAERITDHERMMTTTDQQVRRGDTTRSTSGSELRRIDWVFRQSCFHKIGTYKIRKEVQVR